VLHCSSACSVAKSLFTAGIQAVSTRFFVGRRIGRGGSQRIEHQTCNARDRADTGLFCVYVLVFGDPMPMFSRY